MSLPQAFPAEVEALATGDGYSALCLANEKESLRVARNL
jgi:hypothetical protein